MLQSVIKCRLGCSLPAVAFWISPIEKTGTRSAATDAFAGSLRFKVSKGEVERALAPVALASLQIRVGEFFYGVNLGGYCPGGGFYQTILLGHSSSRPPA